MTEPASEQIPQRLTAHQAATQVSGPLTLAIRVLRIPALLYALIPVVPLIGTFVIALGADGWARVLVAALAVAGGLLTYRFLRRIRQYWRAAQDRAELAEQFVGLFDLLEVSTEVLARFAALAERGGLRLMSRLKALWKVITIPDHVNSHIESFDRARWFVPPAIGETVAMVSTHLWLSLSSWVVFLTLVTLRATGQI